MKTALISIAISCAALAAQNYWQQAQLDRLFAETLKTKGMRVCELKNPGARCFPQDEVDVAKADVR